MFSRNHILINLILAIALDLLIPHLIYSAPIKVGKHKTLELVFAAETSPANPFDTYLLRLEITDPDGFKFQIDGFFDGVEKVANTEKYGKSESAHIRQVFGLGELFVVMHLTAD